VQRERAGREDRRLNSIYTPIDMTSNVPLEQVRLIMVIVDQQVDATSFSKERTNDEFVRMT